MSKSAVQSNFQKANKGGRTEHVLRAPIPRGMDARLWARVFRGLLNADAAPLVGRTAGRRASTARFRLKIVFVLKN